MLLSRGIPALFGLIRFMGEWKGGSVVTENPKGGITENFGRIQRGDHSSSLGKSRHWGGGERESHQILFGGSLQWNNIQSGDRLNFTLFSLKSSPLPPPAINNERSLSCPISLTFNCKCYFVLLILIVSKIRPSLSSVCPIASCKNCPLMGRWRLRNVSLIDLSLRMTWMF